MSFLRLPISSRLAGAVSGSTALGITCGVLLAATLGGWFWAHRTWNEHQHARLSHHLDSIQASFQNRLALHEGLLRSLDGLFRASERVEAAEWRTFAGEFLGRDPTPELEWLLFVSAVEPGKLTAFARDARRDGVRNLHLRSHGSVAEHFLVRFAAAVVEPVPPRFAPGADLRGEPGLSDVLQRSRREGRILAAVLPGGGDGGKEPRVFFVRPVEHPAVGRGWVVSGMRLAWAMEPAFEGIPLELPVEVGLQDLPSAEPLFERSSPEADRGEPVCRTFPGAGRTWTLCAFPGSSYEGLQGGLPPSILLAAGSLVCLLTGAVLLTLRSTERRARTLAEHMRRDLLAQRRLLDSVLDLAPVLFFVVDPRGRLVLAQGRGLEAVGLASTALGTPVERAFASLPALLESWRRVQKGTPAPVTLELGTRAFDVYFLPLEAGGSEDRGTTLITALDVTERRAHEQKVMELLEKIRKDNVELKALDKLRNDFLATVSHELRTPLASIEGYLRLLEGGAGGRLSQEQVALVEPAFRNARRLHALVDDLLDLSRLESGTLQPEFRDVRVEDLLQRVRETLADQAVERGIDFRLEAPDPSRVFRADPFLVERILLNLAGNALKFTPPDGTVTVGAAEGKEEGRPVMRLWVRDTGIGIPAKEQEKIFEKFYQVDHSADRKAGGAGLGLAIVRRLVDLHGGRIFVESAPRQGSTFTVILPQLG